MELGQEGHNIFCVAFPGGLASVPFMNADERSGWTVHVIDDDESLRVAVTRLLSAAGYEVCSYGSAGEFALLRGEKTRGCVLLDVRMPGPTGLDLQEAMAASSNPLPIIFLTGHGDVAMSVRAMKAGAVDFLTKPVRREELLSAVRTALALEASARSTRGRLEDWRERLSSLTPREREVFELVVKGLLNKQVAAELGMAERTVKAHRRNVMEKMRAVSLAELVHIADAMEVGGLLAAN